MAGYVLVEFDRTPPQLEIHSPAYVARDSVTEITVEANEGLSTSQEVYLVDSRGERHDYIFRKEGSNMFVGLIGSTDLPMGVTTLYA